MTASHATAIAAFLAAHPRRTAAFGLAYAVALALAIAAVPRSASDAAAGFERAGGVVPESPPLPILHPVQWPTLEWRRDPFVAGESASGSNAVRDARSKGDAAADPS